jgi:hypothetical protein
MKQVILFEQEIIVKKVSHKPTGEKLPDGEDVYATVEENEYVYFLVAARNGLEAVDKTKWIEGNKDMTRGKLTAVFNNE